MPPLTSQKGIGLSYGSRLPTSTVLTNLPGISRVPTVGLNYNDLGGAFSLPLPLFAAPEIVRRVESGLPATPYLAHLVC